MARLIDTDDLKFPNIAIFDMKLHGVYVPMVRLLDVQELIPTVDAIPVEWLQKQVKEYPKSLWGNMCMYVLEGWRKEQEVR